MGILNVVGAEPSGPIAMDACIAGDIPGLEGVPSVEAGERIAVVCRRGAAQAAVLLCLFAADALVAPISAALGPEALADYVSRIDPSLIVVSAYCAVHVASIRSMGFRERCSVWVLDERLTWFSADRAQGEPSVPGLLIRTSGTTGPASAAHISADAVRANVAAIASRLGLSECDTLLNIMPLTHMNGLAMSLFAASAAKCNLVIQEPLCSSEVSEVVSTHGVTWVSGSPSHLAAILESAEQREHHGLARLRGALTGSAPVPPALCERWRRVGGSRIIEGYGLTEATCRVTLAAPGEERDRLAGPPLMGEVKIDSPVGPGPVLVRGPHVFLGYWREPARTERALRDGWLHTGDIGQWVSGQLQLLGRADEQVHRNGIRIEPLTIDAVAHRTGMVREAHTLGLADEHSGVRLVQVIVPHDSRFSPDEYWKQLKSRLDLAELPDEVVVVPMLERLPSGKVPRWWVRSITSRRGRG